MLLEQYILFSKFLSQVLGPDYEIVVYNTEMIVHIENSHITNRKKGDPVHHIIKRLISDKDYIDHDSNVNKRALSENGKVLRSSIFYIKDEFKNLIGIFCINFDDNRYRELSENIFFAMPSELICL